MVLLKLSSCTCNHSVPCLENWGNTALFPCPFLPRLVCTVFQDRLTDTVWACVWSPILTKLILDVACKWRRNKIENKLEVLSLSIYM